MTITIGDKDWRPAYAVLLGYALLCALTVVFAPTKWTGLTPTATRLSHFSDFPVVTAFCVDAMWVSFPIALLVFSMLAPLKIRKDNPKPQVFLFLGFLAFGLLVTPLVFHIYWSQIDPVGSGSMARQFRWASHSKIGLLVVQSTYFSALVFLAWLSYVAIPQVFLRLRHEA